jgi:uncharacterized protein (TIGR02246 family)
MHTTPSPPGPPSCRASDEQQVIQTLLVLATALATSNAEALHAVYSADADWIGADGTELRGRDAIVEHHRRRFAKPDLATGALIGAPTLSLRWLADDVVIAATHLQRRLQRTFDGRTVPPRRTHSLNVLTRHASGTGLIVSHLDADVHDPHSAESGPPT